MKKIFLITNQESPRLRYAPAPPFNKGGRTDVPPLVKWGKGGFSFAFTLAEVLITLGIIGVVASLTMPGLVKDYQNKVYETSNLVFENRFGEALRQMNIAEDLTGHTETADFVTALQKYLKIINVCDENNLTNCFTDKISIENTIPVDVSKAYFAGAPERWGTKLNAIVLQNGHSAIIQYNPNCQSGGITATANELKQCVSVAYDTNAKSHPNEYNKDINGDLLMHDVVPMVTLPSGLKVTAGDIPYEPVGNDWWQGAANECAKLGLSLPTCGLSGTEEANCKTAGAHQNTPACQIYNYCVSSGTCSHVYWLKEAGSKPGICSPAAFTVAINAVAKDNLAAGLLFAWCNDRTNAAVDNGIIPKLRCVKP